MTIPYFPRRRRASHRWRLRQEGLRELLIAKKWGLRGGYASKTIRGREVMMTVVSEEADCITCSFCLKGDFWADITAMARAREADERRRNVKVVPPQEPPGPVRRVGDIYTDALILRQRGWTETLIRRFLGEPDEWSDERWPNPGGRRLYTIVRANEVEATAEFAAALAASLKRRRLCDADMERYLVARGASLAAQCAAGTGPEGGMER